MDLPYNSFIIFFLIFVGFFVLNLALVIFKTYKRRKNGPVVPKITDAGVLFAERFASGSSHKNFLTRMGGANRCLTIIVTESQLAVNTFFPFTYFSDKIDMEHVIPISKVTECVAKGTVVEIDFIRDDGTAGKISLYLKSPAEFMQAIQKAKLSHLT